jgi:hypothetical protein
MRFTMSSLGIKRDHKAYKIECEEDCRSIVSKDSAIGNPSDHVPDKSSVRPYPVLFPLGVEVIALAKGVRCAAAPSRTSRPSRGATSASGVRVASGSRPRGPG